MMREWRKVNGQWRRREDHGPWHQLVITEQERQTVRNIGRNGTIYYDTTIDKVWTWQPINT